MAEIFESYSESMPEWANKSLKEELVKDVDESEGEQKKERNPQKAAL